MLQYVDGYGVCSIHRALLGILNAVQKQMGFECYLDAIVFFGLSAANRCCPLPDIRRAPTTAG